MISTFWLVIILSVLSLPLLGLLAWIMFDDLRSSGESIVLGLVKALALLLSRKLFFFVDSEHEDDGAMINLIVIFVAYALIIFGEYAAIAAWWPNLIAT